LITKILLSRSIPLYVVCLVILTIGSYVLGRAAIRIDLSYEYPENRLPYVELCALLGGIMSTILLRPRFWEWDHIGTWRASVVSTLCAFVGIALPSLVVIVGSLRLPPGTSWLWSLSNAGVICAIISLMSVVVGPSFAAGVGLLLWFGFGVVNNIAPWLSGYLPLSGFREQEPRWWLWTIMALLTLAVHAYTRGSTAWVQRMSQKEHAM